MVCRSKISLSITRGETTLPGIGYMILLPWVGASCPYHLQLISRIVIGAFAFFGPGVYDSTDVYSQMLRPAARGKLFFAGEAASACHA